MPATAPSILNYEFKLILPQQPYKQWPVTPSVLFRACTMKVNSSLLLSISSVSGSKTKPLATSHVPPFFPHEWGILETQLSSSSFIGQLIFLQWQGDHCASQKIKIHQDFTSPHNPPTNGTIERSNTSNVIFLRNIASAKYPKLGSVIACCHLCLSH